MNSAETVAPDRSGLSPLQIVRTYSAEEWEAFIEEWAGGFDPPYAQVVKMGGAGDKGRDLVAYVTDPTDRSAAWDSYQCKHYGHALYPTDAYTELGKLCVYTFDGSFSVPRKYRFVAPFGVGTSLHDLLRSPDRLRAELIANWDGYCRRKITERGEVALEGALRQYVERFDFSIVWFLTVAEIIEQHRRTNHWYRRFKIDPPLRPRVGPVPEELQTYELPYLGRLLEAYSDHLRRPIVSSASLDSEPQLRKHFKRSREYFFSAEALGRFSRDHFGDDAFDDVKRHVYDGVVDTAEATHEDGLACLRKVTELAVLIELPKSQLKEYLEPSDKKGLCHHLANDGELTWCADADK